MPQKKLTFKGERLRTYIVTKQVEGKNVQTTFLLSPSMSDKAIYAAVQGGVPSDLFEHMKGFKSEFKKLKRFQRDLSVQAKRLSNTVRSGLVNMAGQPITMDDLLASTQIQKIDELKKAAEDEAAKIKESAQSEADAIMKQAIADAAKVKKAPPKKTVVKKAPPKKTVVKKTPPKKTTAKA